MHSRFLRSVLVALALAGSYHVSTAAQSDSTAAAPSAVYLVCQTKDRGQILIFMANFGGFAGAMKQCASFWHGRPVGLLN
jgi:hypothetical protein